MSIIVNATTHPGMVRERNEDCGGACSGASRFVLGGDTRRGTLDTWGDSALVVVADGLGGHPSGDVASRIATEHLLDAAPGDGDELVAAVHGANRSIYDAMGAAEDRREMGTTIAAVLIHRDALTVVNVGDSPVFEWDGSELIELSVRDSLSADDDPSGWNAHVVTQTLGGGHTHRSVHPHVHRLENDRPRRLMLCTDGLTDFASQHAILHALDGSSPATAAERLVAAALDGGGGDNVTVAVIDVD